MKAEIKNILEDFEFMSDWEDKYTYIIELAKKMPAIDDQYKTDQYKVEGCMSNVWLAVDQDKTTSDAIYFHADSDAIIVKGLVALLMAIYNGESAQNIAQTDIESIFKQLGLENHLSPIRRNGFYSMVKTIGSIATDQNHS